MRFFEIMGGSETLENLLRPARGSAGTLVPGGVEPGVGEAAAPTAPVLDPPSEEALESVPPILRPAPERAAPRLPASIERASLLPASVPAAPRVDAARVMNDVAQAFTVLVPRAARFLESATIPNPDPGILGAARLIGAGNRQLLYRINTEMACGPADLRAAHIFVIAAQIVRRLELSEREVLEMAVAVSTRPRLPDERMQKVNRRMLLFGAAWVASFYHDLVHDRAPERRLPPHQVMRRLLAEEGDWISREIRRRLIEEFSLFPPGSLVRLNDGKTARVLDTHPSLPTRPKLGILGAGPGGKAEIVKLLDLREAPLIHIDMRSFGPSRSEPRRRVRKRRWVR